jgi:hypothetical protein
MTTSLDRIVFARRQSPDWEALARDHEAGVVIETSRYRPRTAIPGFPNDIVACVRIWNDTFPVNFFRCRQYLKAIADRCLRQVDQSMIIAADRLRDLPALVGDARFLLFFFDDDDWFAPDLFECVSTMDFAQCDVAVFPLARLGEKVFTFVRDGETARAVLGVTRGFGHRYQTNNYGITRGIALSDRLPRLQDHVLASTYATEINLRDAWFDALISATNKTPCSANTIGALLADPVRYRGFIRGYVEVLRGLELAPELAWITRPVSETIELFATI